MWTSPLGIILASHRAPDGPFLRGDVHRVGDKMEDGESRRDQSGGGKCQRVLFLVREGKVRHQRQRKQQPGDPPAEVDFLHDKVVRFTG